ncbi:MAG: DUF3368 domain-containing protein [Chloroflexi bacterium]|nr:DUF3368 domain-containing protein [Chloroflexota bacterium]
MPVPPVIVNNTPLVALWSLGKLGLLGDLFGTVWLPTAVEAEFLDTRSVVRRQILAESSWLQTISLTDPRHALTYVGLDQGEAEVLALAVEYGAQLVIMDERKGRRYARRLGLSLTGTLGVLLLAKEQGLITAVAPLLEQLLDEGLYFAPSLIEQTLLLAQEA